MPSGSIVKNVVEYIVSQIVEDPKSVKVCKEIHVDISMHICQPLTTELVSWAEYILVMERKHASHIREHFPNVQDAILELGTFGGLTEVPDPIGGWTFQFRRCRKQIDKCLVNFLQQLARH